MYPAEGSLLLVGDRPGTPDGSPYRVPPDVVYPGAIENTRHFLATLPQKPCEAFLDIGTGSGVAALSAPRYAEHAWGVDIAGPLGAIRRIQPAHEQHRERDHPRKATCTNPSAV